MHRSFNLLLLVSLFVGGCAAPSFCQEYDPVLASYLEEEGYDGVILLYDYNGEQMFTSNRLKMNDRVLPASTFKIFNTLLFLELGLARDTSHTLAWDGTEYSHKGRKINAWCKDTNLAQAFRNSTVWYYVKMSESIHFSVYRDYLKLLKYGRVRHKKKDGLDFWNYGNRIGISALDQFNFLFKLYENKLAFKESHQQTVKELMIEKKTDDYILRSKTGWTVGPGKLFKKDKDLGWYVGYIEFEKNVYFFAVRIEKRANSEDKDFSKDRKSFTWNALKYKFGIDLRS